MSESCQHYLMEAKHRFNFMNNIVEYKAYVRGMKMVVNMNV